MLKHETLSITSTWVSRGTYCDMRAKGVHPYVLQEPFEGFSKRRSCALRACDRDGGMFKLLCSDVMHAAAVGAQFG